MEAKGNEQGGPNASSGGTNDNDSTQVSIEDDAFLYLSTNEIVLLGEGGLNYDNSGEGASMRCGNDGSIEDVEVIEEERVVGDESLVGEEAARVYFDSEGADTDESDSENEYNDYMEGARVDDDDVGSEGDGDDELLGMNNDSNGLEGDDFFQKEGIKSSNRPE